MLALNAGSTVSTERLIEGLWGEEPPASAPKMVQLYVSQLRKALAASAGRRGDRHARPRLRAAARAGRRRCGAVRAARGERRAARGAGAVARPAARRRGRRAVRGRRDPAAGGAAAGGARAGDRADLAAGRHREVVGELEALVADEPLRERLHAQRMLALYRSGRQADALAAYRQARDGAGGGDRRRARRRAAAAARGDPAPGPVARAAGAPVELPPELDAGTPLVGPRRRAGVAARALARRARRRRPAGAGRRARAGSARRAWWPSWRARCIAIAARCSTRRRGRARAALAALARAGAARGRRCSCSTTSTAPARRCSRALDELAGRLAALPVLVLATAEDAQLARPTRR